MARPSMEELREKARLAPRPSAEEREIRDRLRQSWIDKAELWDNAEWPINPRSPYGRIGMLYWRAGGIRGAYTTVKMFDGKFWSMKFTYRKSGPLAGRYVLTKSSVRFHGKRKDANARAHKLVYGYLP